MMSNQRNNPLLLAATNGDYRQIQYILKEEEGIDVNISNSYGRTPLSLACRNGHVYVVKLLIDHGANVNNKDQNEWTPLFYACRNGHVNIVRLLIDHGANVNSKDSVGWTPLSHACQNEYVDVARLLIGNGASVNIKDYWAFVFGSVDVVELLIDHITNINAKDDDGFTPLHHASACWGDEPHIVQLLLRNGANTSIKTLEGETAEVIARINGNNNTVDCLQQYRLELRRKVFAWSKRRRNNKGSSS